MAEDLRQHLWRDIANCECFSLQLHGSTDTGNTAQLCIFCPDDVYRYDCKRGAINITAHERMHEGKTLWRNHQLPVCKLCAVLMAVGTYVHYCCQFLCAMPRVTLLCQNQLCIVGYNVPLLNCKLLSGSKKIPSKPVPCSWCPLLGPTTSTCWVYNIYS